MRAQFIAIGLALLGLTMAAPNSYAALQRQAVDDGLYVHEGYDARRDPREDLRVAIARAQESHKRILLEVGGNWCVWCHILDRYLTVNRDVRTVFRETFVVVKVHWSRDQRNEAFLRNYPQSSGYPDFIILDSDGRFLGTQDTSQLEEGRGYSNARMIAFAQRWRRR